MRVFTVCCFFVAAAAGCRNAEAPLAPPSVSLSAKSAEVGQIVIMNADFHASEAAVLVWYTADAQPAVPASLQHLSGSAFYAKAVGTGWVHAVLYPDSTSFNVIAQDSAPVTVTAPSSSNRPAFMEIEAGAGWACGLSAPGDVYCWGNTSGFPSIEPSCGREFHRSWSFLCNTIPTKVMGVPRFKFIDAGTASVCGITLEDETYCWPALPSSLSFGQRGIVPGGKTFKSVSVELGPDFDYDDNLDHVCGLTAAYDVYCWQRNATTTVPAQVPGKFASVSIGGWWKGGSGLYRACALDNSGAAFCWGTAALGDGNPMPTTEQLNPVAVGDTLRFIQLSLGGQTACGLTAAGEVFCWGGDPFKTVLTPRRVDTEIRFKTISVADQSFCGLVADSSLYCWTTYPTFQAPQRVTTNFHFSAISVGGESSSCGITVEGPEVCWGDNIFGVLGNGSLGISSAVPTPVAGQRLFP